MIQQYFYVCHWWLPGWSPCVSVVGVWWRGVLAGLQPELGQTQSVGYSVASSCMAPSHHQQVLVA